MTSSPFDTVFFFKSMRRYILSSSASSAKGCALCGGKIDLTNSYNIIAKGMSPCSLATVSQTSYHIKRLSRHARGCLRVELEGTDSKKYIYPRGSTELCEIQLEQISDKLGVCCQKELD